ncbi:MAG: class I SAM-dependent methyltransferase [Candidatus Omnitrophica bacterium]|nr:class I SAM-dependent methyltransferase [Candidatus Omnitrophota bacterium]
MNNITHTQKLWNSYAARTRAEPHIDHLLGKYKSEEFINIVKEWTDDLEHKKILKTDLNEEAYGADEILFSFFNDMSQVFALDISKEIVKKAYERQIDKHSNHHYINADVRDLPFQNNAFDLILSTSTLDHFIFVNDFKQSLVELKRILKPKGQMIIALNNAYNLNFYLMLKIQRILGLKSYPVQFYSLKTLQRICAEVGLFMQAADYIVHIISPINSILLLLRRSIFKDNADAIARKCILLFKWLGGKKISRCLTGWFIVVKCVK